LDGELREGWLGFRVYAAAMKTIDLEEMRADFERLIEQAAGVRRW
jgi:hypothetical protein